MSDFQSKYILPFYLNILHANYLFLNEKDKNDFINNNKTILSEIDQKIVSQLLNGFWREKLVGAWFAGLKNYNQFTDIIGNLLINSETCYACQLYIFALTCFNTSESVSYILRYLDKWFLSDKQYDQNWAISALFYLDKINNTNYIDKYINNSKIDFEKIMKFCPEILK